MPRYPYRCPRAGCGRPFYKVLPVAMASTRPPCPCCGATGERVWTAPQIVTYGDIDAHTQPLPLMSSVEPMGRNSRQLAQDYKEVLGKKREYFRRRERERGTSKRKGMRYLGSVPAHELLAARRKTGNHHILNEDRKAFLKRTGNNVVSDL